VSPHDVPDPDGRGWTADALTVAEYWKEQTMNRTKLRVAIPMLVMVLGLSSVPALQAQVTKESLDGVRTKLQAPQDFYNKLTDNQRKMLSGGALNFFHTIENWSQLEKAALAGKKPLASNSRGRLPLEPESTPGVGTTSGPIRVSNPRTDFDFGPSSGFTQSETSTAWCGNNVVVAYNDSGSYWESGFATNFQNLSFNGFSTSANQGRMYVDQGYLPSATANPINFLEGDPVVACTSVSTFFQSSLFFTVASLSPYTPLNAISVSKSTDGGKTFGAPLIAASKNAFTHFLDKEWMAVNSAHPSQMAVTYTDFDNSFTACPTSFRTAIELVASTDGGNTWSAPQVVFEACNAAPNFPSVQGSQVAFSPSGSVDVAYELYSAGVATGRQIEFQQAASLGGTFGAAVPVANVRGVGDGFAVQGGIRAFVDIQGMAVDRTGLATNGNIYIVFHDSTNFVEVFDGNPYGYSDAMIVKSIDNGATWGAPVQVNTSPEPLRNGLGTDAYMPGVAVDNSTGEVAVCWYDRRNDPRNFRVDRFCGQSTDAAATFTNFRVTSENFAPIHGTDDLINPSYFGDYDTVVSDTLKMTRGFIGAFQVERSEGERTLVPNPDVVANNFD
jgi:hypothetical protein